jgi:hypothetical protein
LATFVSATGCNEISFLVQAPEVRGITIPLPPPSLTSTPVQRVDFEGQLGNGVESIGTKVLVYDRVGELGFFAFADGGDWFIPEVKLDLTDNCVVVESVDSDGENSVRQFYKLELRDLAECVPGCTQPDDEDVCACFVEWDVGC